MPAPFPRARCRKHLRLLQLILAVIVASYAPRALALDPSLRLTQYMHQSWTSNDGLPQDSVNDIAQTPDGYLWLATQEGIARFDGTRFTIFDSRTTRGTVTNFVYTLLVDRRGTLWAGASSGLVRYDGNGQFSVIGEKQGWPGTAAKYLAEDREGNLWAGMGNGTAIGGKGLVRFSKGRVKIFTMADGLANNQVYESSMAPDGALWIGTGNGVSVLRDGRFTSYGVKDGLPDPLVRAVLADRAGTVWLGTAHGLTRYRNGQFTTLTTRDGLRHDEILTIDEDRHGVIWVGTVAGVNRVIGDGVEAAPALMRGLAADSILDHFEDREGSLWVGTHSSGLHRLRAGKFAPIGSPEGLVGESVTALYQDRSGTIWVGTSSGYLNAFDGSRWRNWPVTHGTSRTAAKAILEDRAGALWVGTSEGLLRFDNGRFTPVASKPGVQTLHEDGAGTLWVGQGYGLSKLVDGRLENVDLGSATTASIRLLYHDRSGRFWIGGGDGLGYLANGRYVPFLVQPEIDLNVIAVTEDPDGTLWFSTWNSGIYRVKSGKVRRFTSADGLYDDIAWGIVDDGRGNFWMSSNRGISLVTRRELNAFADGRSDRITPVVFGTQHGMRRRETNLSSPAILRTRTGQLWFPTTTGIATIDPARVRTNRLPPPVTIEQFLADDKQVVPGENGFVVRAGTRNIEIHYAALSLAAAPQVRYRYKLEGFDEHWIDAGSRRIAYYTNIDPGSYTFRVIAANEDGVWNEKGSSLAFRLRPRVRQTWWFYAIIVLALATLVAALHILRLRQREIRHQVYHDALTGLPNRRLLSERGEVALTLARRKSHSIAILFLDLDGFKSVNDNLGHAAGDRLLQFVAARLASCIRDVDTLARIGGDEFAVLVADLTDESRAAEVAQRLIVAMRRKFSVDGNDVTLGVSVGIALHPFDGADIGTMLQAADRAMYRSKLAGGDSYVFNAADPDEKVTIEADSP